MKLRCIKTMPGWLPETEFTAGKEYDVVVDHGGLLYVENNGCMVRTINKEEMNHRVKPGQFAHFEVVL